MTGAPATPTRLHRRGATTPYLVMLLAGALGLVLALSVLGDDQARTRILVATRDLPALTVLRASDVDVEAVRLGDAVADRLLGATRRDELRGRVLVASVRRGDPLLTSHVRTRPTDDGRRAVSIPVDRSRAVNGRLDPGDRVDVVVAHDGVAQVLAADLEVLDVDGGESGAFGARRGELTVTLAVDVVGAQLLAAALAEGDFVLARVTGATPAGAVAPLAVEGGGAP